MPIIENFDQAVVPAKRGAPSQAAAAIAGGAGEKKNIHQPEKYSKMDKKKKRENLMFRDWEGEILIKKDGNLKG